MAVKKKKTRDVGRPKLPKGKALSKLKGFRFQEGELAAYEKSANAEGLTLSEWVRKTLNNNIIY